MKVNRPFILTIAGFDPSGGAGILADCKTAEAFDVTCLAVTTAVTYQNETNFVGLKWLSLDNQLQQLQPLLDLYTIEVVKIGLIASLDNLSSLVSILKKYNANIKIIWDPILQASSGFEFHRQLDAAKLKAVLESIYLITPNIPEMIQLTNCLGLDAKAENLSKYTNVLLKGGHSATTEAVDTLFLTNNTNQSWSSTKLSNRDKHGTGCMLSAAIASGLATQNALAESISHAKAFVLKRIASNDSRLAWYTERTSH